MLWLSRELRPPRADDAAPEADQEPEVEEADVADEDGDAEPEGGGDADVVREG